MRIVRTNNNHIIIRSWNGLLSLIGVCFGLLAIAFIIAALNDNGSIEAALMMTLFSVGAFAIGRYMNVTFDIVSKKVICREYAAFRRSKYEVAFDQVKDVQIINHSASNETEIIRLRLRNDETIPVSVQPRRISYILLYKNKRTTKLAVKIAGKIGVPFDDARIGWGRK